MRKRRSSRLGQGKGKSSSSQLERGREGGAAAGGREKQQQGKGRSGSSNLERRSNSVVRVEKWRSSSKAREEGAAAW